MKVAIVGSRDFEELDLVKLYIAFLPADTEIVSGGAKGVDTAAKEAANDFGMKYTEFLPDWEKYGRAAGPIRNKQIVEHADRVVAFSREGKTSAGTQSTINLARKMKKPLEVYKTGQGFI